MRIPSRYLLVIGTFCLSVLLYVDRICISAAKGEIAADLSLSDRQMGWVLSVFALGYALFQTPGGWLADRLGPRRVLSSIVVLWSIFTGLTAAAFNFPTMLLTRFLFGAGEAGAFPGLAQAAYSWIPMHERGIVQGINFSGSRIGGAASLVAIPALISANGWRASFVTLMVVGCAWAVFWFWWFRDDPHQHRTITPEELDFIVANRQSAAEPADLEHRSDSLSLSRVFGSRNVWLISVQYFCSNFTFFFCLTWLFPHLKETYKLTGMQAGLYSAAPLLCGAIGNWTAGWMVDRIYRSGRWVASRRIPAILGFVLAAVGLMGSVAADSVTSSIVWFSLAILGADMTLAPSWSFCIDIGKRNSGVVSGTMNMAGNVGSFLTALAFPYLAAWTGSNTPFFFLAAGLNALAVFVWMLVDPRQSLSVGIAHAAAVEDTGQGFS